MKKNQPTPDSPLHENPIDAFQINAAREFHRLTTGSRYPRKGNPRQTTTSAATAGETSAGASKRSTPTASASKNTGPGVASAKKPSPVPVPVPVPHVHTENATRGPACNNPLCAHCGQVIIPAPVATFPVQDTPSICINNEWFVLTQRLPILNAKEIDTFEDILDGLPVPEMIFGNNKVEVIQKHFHLMFNTLDALKLVQRNPENLIKVSYANEWFKTRQQKHKNSENVSLEVFRPYDWTYSSTYKGTVLKGAELWTSDLDGNYKIPVSKLSNDNPIKFYDDMILYEDELGDNGISILNVKIRVMSDCLLILQRLFIRVDDVLVKIIDTRVYIDFDDYLIIREQKQMESSYRDVLLKIPACPDPKKYLRDINWCSANLPIVETQREYINLPRE